MITILIALAFLVVVSMLLGAMLCWRSARQAVGFCAIARGGTRAEADEAIAGVTDALENGRRYDPETGKHRNGYGLAWRG